MPHRASHKPDYFGHGFEAAVPIDIVPCRLALKFLGHYLVGFAESRRGRLLHRSLLLQGAERFYWCRGPSTPIKPLRSLK